MARRLVVRVLRRLSARVLRRVLGIRSPSYGFDPARLRLRGADWLGLDEADLALIDEEDGALYRRYFLGLWEPATASIEPGGVAK